MVCTICECLLTWYQSCGGNLLQYKGLTGLALKSFSLYLFCTGVGILQDKPRHYGHPGQHGCLHPACYEPRWIPVHMDHSENTYCFAECSCLCIENNYDNLWFPLIYLPQNRMWRKNRSVNRSNNCIGVDLNRNFDANWCSESCTRLFWGIHWTVSSVIYESLESPLRWSDSVSPSGGGLWWALHWDLLRCVSRVGTRVAGRGRLPAQSQGLSAAVPQHPLLLADAALPVLLHPGWSREPQRPGEGMVVENDLIPSLRMQNTTQEHWHVFVSSSF